jgi:hypothetical protein
MRSVRFRAYGHENIIGLHRTTLEITREDTLTRKGTCIVAIGSNLSLSELDAEIKSLAKQPTTAIRLVMAVAGLSEEIAGRGSAGLTYSDNTSMVARRSSYECGRTLMVQADKAASDLSRAFVEATKKPGAQIECELFFISR